MNEIWKDITDYVGVYQASSLGRLRRVSKTDSIGRCYNYSDLKIRTLPRYDAAIFCHNGKRKMMLLHQVIAQTFLQYPTCCPTCKTPYEINHIDGNPHNNAADNLEYVTHVENIQKSRNARRKKQWKSLDDTKVLKIKHLLAQKITSQVEISKMFNVSKSTISEIAHNRIWTDVSL